MYTQRSMAILIPFLIINLTMYGTPSTCTVTFGIGEGMELTKLGLLDKSHAQLVVWWHGRCLKYIR